MYNALIRRGFECHIFTANGETRHPVPVYGYDDLPLLLGRKDDLVIYHYCIADPRGLQVLRRAQVNVVVRYHNVTPASFMMKYDPDFARWCRQGRELLADFSQLPLIGILSDSDYNGAEAARLCPPEIAAATLPPFHRIEELFSFADDRAIQAKLSENWFNILTVGRIVPNKALDIMLEAFARALKDDISGVALHIVGQRDPRLSGYWQMLDELIEQQEIAASVVWHEGASATRLATLYRNCDLFWTTSQHEGFCVPVVEAMAFGLPVLSSSQAALPETCGSAAILADGVEETASELARLVTDDLLRMELAENGRLRYRNVFRLGDLERQFVSIIERFSDLSQHVGDDASAPLAGDWFGIPDAEILARKALECTPQTSAYQFSGSERRRNFIDWTIRQGRLLSADVRECLRSEAFRHFAEELHVPETALHLKPQMRLAWHFDAEARTGFTLDSAQDVAAFLRWYRENAATSYEPCFS
ncbi:glycosyltransferase family 4 protein [Rhizobium sp. FY34]|uniref:glycosyltransferase family 4 protein n=1 Tax=Rhizobium sp. FY34 TaxID=2562309 RepID=UPI00148501B3|nr:glycosyltransferase family 4 protein [Rhizobium sp. FY34]